MSTYVVKEKDDFYFTWMDALSGVIGNNCVPWWGSDITITPFNEDFRGNGIFKNVGYVIKINSWPHLAVAYKTVSLGNGNELYRIATPDKDWLERCGGWTCYDDYCENEYKKSFWEATINLLREHVAGEKELIAYKDGDKPDCEKLKKLFEDGRCWCHICEQILLISEFPKTERCSGYGTCNSCKLVYKKSEKDTAE